MPCTYEASAPAKVILFGEHAVVYGEPAIAVPISRIRTRVWMEPNESGFAIQSDAGGGPDLSGVQQLINSFREDFGIGEMPSETLRIASQIPIASGLGSGAALSCAVTKCLMKRFGVSLTADEINARVYEIEKLYHGTPSGIDNTVICYEKPLYFIKNRESRIFSADIHSLPLLVVDSGIRSRTVDAVSDVRAHFDKNEPLIRQIGSLVREAVYALLAEDEEIIGALMNENQRLLRGIDVSCGLIDECIADALRHGARGAKLTGAGRGGNFIVLAKDAENAESLRALFRKKGLNVIL